MIGRLLGGVATSLLFSVFDAWLIKAHAEAKLDRVRIDDEMIQWNIMLNSYHYCILI